MSSVLTDTMMITKKEIAIFLKQPLFGVVRSLIFPLVWILFFAYGFGGTLHSIPIGIVNEANGLYSQQIVDNIATGNTFDIRFLPYYQALKDFQDKKIFAIVHIPSDFNNKFQSNEANAYLILDSTNPTVSVAIRSNIELSVQKVSSQIKLDQTPPVNLNEEVFYGKEIRYIDFLAPGIVVQTIVFSAMFSGGISLLMDKEFGTLKLLMLAPISRASIIIGKTLGGVLEALIAGFATLFIIILLGAKIQFSLMLFFAVPLIMILTAFAFIGMSTLIATRLKTLEQFVLTSQLLILPLWFVSGAIYPTYSMPAWMQAFATVNPLTYAVDAVRTAMIRGGMITPIIPDISILIAFSTIILLIGIRSFKRTIE